MEVIYRNKNFKKHPELSVEGNGVIGEQNSDVKTQEYELLDRGDDSGSPGIKEQQIDEFCESEEMSSHVGTDSHCPMSASSSVSAVEVDCTLQAAALSLESYHTSTLNGIVLEYLELLGLENTYKTFWEECLNSSIPLPKNLRDPIFRRTKFTESEIETFFHYFDTWDSDALFEHWNKFLEEVEDKTAGNVIRVGILIRIFIASLPHRKNESDAYKVNALDELREFHHAYSEDFMKDPVCLQLFGFPFVADPGTHPAFTYVFTDEWQSGLRSEFQELFQLHLATHNTYGPSTCDLTQMYFHFTEDENVVDDGELPEVLSPQGTCDPDVIQPDTWTAMSESSDMSDVPNLKTLVKLSSAMNPEVSDYVKRTLVHTQDRYCKLLSATQAVVGALEQAIQGKPQDIRILEVQLQSSFPELFNPNFKKSSDSNKLQDTTGESVEGPGNLELTDPETVIAQDEIQTTEQEMEPPKEGSIEEIVCDAEATITPKSAAEPVPVVETETINKDDEVSGDDVQSESETDDNELDAADGSCTPDGSFTGTDSPLALSGRSVISSSRKSGRQSQPSPPASAAIALSSPKLTDSTVDTRPMLRDATTPTDDSEVPQQFSQYFTSMASSMHCGRLEPKKSLLPPSVAEPFPEPPRTYEVSPRNCKIIFIPSQIDLDRNLGTTKPQPMSNLPKRIRQSNSISSSGDQRKPEVITKSKQILSTLPTPSDSRSSLTPTEKRSTPMASIMGLGGPDDSISKTNILPRKNKPFRMRVPGLVETSRHASVDTAKSLAPSLGHASSHPPNHPNATLPSKTTSAFVGSNVRSLSRYGWKNEDGSALKNRSIKLGGKSCKESQLAASVLTVKGIGQLSPRS